MGSLEQAGHQHLSHWWALGFIKRTHSTHRVIPTISLRHACHVNPHNANMKVCLRMKMDNIFLRQTTLHRIQTKIWSWPAQTMQMTSDDQRLLPRCEVLSEAAGKWPSFKPKPQVRAFCRHTGTVGCHQEVGEASSEDEDPADVEGHPGHRWAAIRTANSSYGNTIVLTPSKCAPDTLLTHTVFPLLGFLRCHLTIVT